MLKDLQTPVYSVATWAKERGCRVGVATSVSVDHATPAAFYAHASGRGSYYEIGKDLYETGFDFYAGSDFLQPQDKKIRKQPTFTHWLINTDTPLPEDIKIISRRAKS